MTSPDHPAAGPEGIAGGISAPQREGLADEQGMIDEGGAGIDAAKKAALELWDRSDTIDEITRIMRENVYVKSNDVIHVALLQLVSRHIYDATSTYIVIRAPAGTGKSRFVSTLKIIGGTLLVKVKGKPIKGPDGKMVVDSEQTKIVPAVVSASMSNHALVYSKNVIPDNGIVIFDDIGAEPDKALIDSLKEAYERDGSVVSRIVTVMGDTGAGAQMYEGPRDPQFIICNTEIPEAFEHDPAFRSREIRFDLPELSCEDMNKYIKPIMDVNCSFEASVNRKADMSEAVFVHFWNLLLGTDQKVSVGEDETDDGPTPETGLESIFVEVPEKFRPSIVHPSKAREYATVITWMKCFCLLRKFRGDLANLPKKTAAGRTLYVIEAEEEDARRAVDLMNRVAPNAVHTPDGIQIPNAIRGMRRVILEWLISKRDEYSETITKTLTQWGKMFSDDMRKAHTASLASSSNAPLQSDAGADSGRQLLELCRQNNAKVMASYPPSSFETDVCGRRDKKSFPYGGICGYSEVQDMGVSVMLMREPATGAPTVNLTVETREMKPTREYTVGPSSSD